MPSRFQVFSVVPAPFASTFDCWPDSAPPTLTRSTTTPGTVCSTTHGSRADGMFCSCSYEMLVVMVCRPGSTTSGDAITFTASLTPPTVSATVSGTLRPAVTSMLSLRYGLNPLSAAATEYLPGGRFRKWASPLASVVCDADCGPETSTATPGTVLPCASVTVTSMRPWNIVCANA